MDIPSEGIPLSDILDNPLPAMGDEPFNVINRVSLVDDVPDDPTTSTPVDGYAVVLDNGIPVVYPPTDNDGSYPSMMDVTGHQFEARVLHELGSLSARMDAVLRGQLVADGKLDYIGQSMQWLTNTFNGIQQAAMNMPGLMGGMVRKMTTGGKS